MTLSIELVIRKAYKAWRKNLILGVPYLVSLILNLFLLVSYIAIVVFALNPLRNIGDLTIYNWSESINWGLVVLDLILFFILMVLMGLLASFFSAGAIGMCGQALTKGKTSLDALIEHGSKRFIHIFIANVIIFAITLVLILALLILQIILRGSYIEIAAIFLSLLFAITPYAIVLGKSNALDALKESADFFMANKLAVFIIWAFSDFISTVAYLISLILGVLIFSLPFLLLNLDSLVQVSKSPLEILNQEFIAALIPAGMGFLTAAVIIFIIFVFIATFVISPLVNLFYSGLYLDAGKRHKQKK